MATKKELNDEANDLNLKWRREERRREEAEATLRNMVAAAEKGITDYNEITSELDEYGYAVYPAVEIDPIFVDLAVGITVAKEALK